MTAKEYKEYKSLRKEDLRDNMTDVEVARSSGKIAGNTGKELEQEIGENIITSNNALSYEYLEEKEIEMKNQLIYKIHNIFFGRIEYYVKIRLKMR